MQKTPIFCSVLCVLITGVYEMTTPEVNAPEWVPNGMLYTSVIEAGKLRSLASKTGVQTNGRRLRSRRANTRAFVPY